MGEKFYVHFRLLRLRLMKMQKPEDAKTAEEMLKEIKAELQRRINTGSSGCCDMPEGK